MSAETGYPINLRTQKGSPAVLPSNASNGAPNDKAMPRMIFLERSGMKYDMINTTVNGHEHKIVIKAELSRKPRRRLA